jgi:hypothetical protein
VELAVDAAVNASADALPPRWADAVRASGSRPGEDLVAALDETVATVDLELWPPSWWRLAAAVQFLLGQAAVLGAVWLFLIGASQLIGHGLGDPVRVIGIPLPLLLLVVGLGGGAALAGFGEWALVVGARLRRLGAQDRLHDAVEMVAEEWVIAPVRAVLDQHRITRLALAGDGVAQQSTFGAAPAPGPGQADLGGLSSLNGVPERAADVLPTRRTAGPRADDRTQSGSDPRTLTV